MPTTLHSASAALDGLKVVRPRVMVPPEGWEAWRRTIASDANASVPVAIAVLLAPEWADGPVGDLAPGWDAPPPR